MLSKENVEKIVETGLYRHEPDKRYRGSLYHDNLYWCFNWTFRPRYTSNDGKWYMVDTYFNDEYIELTDENFDEFEFVFDFNEVKSHSGQNIEEYGENDWWHVAVDSGGMYCGGKYFVRKGATKNKEKVLERIQSEIRGLENMISSKQREYEKVLNDEIGLDLV